MLDLTAAARLFQEAGPQASLAPERDFLRCRRKADGTEACDDQPLVASATQLRQLLCYHLLVFYLHNRGIHNQNSAILLVFAA